MTYIKWKDEVESYLGNLSESEKQKVFSYFAEMYADKRDAGISEEKIIEGFGAPYDVAKRILADSKDNAPKTDNSSGAVSGAGGNNYNYNYYNYNYGGAPADFDARDRERATDFDYREERRGRYDDVDVSDIDMPLPEGTPKPKEKKGGRHPLFTLLMLVLLAVPLLVILSAALGMTVGLFSAAAGCIVSGCMTIGEAAGGLAAGLGTDQIGLMGAGFIQFAVGLFLIPLSVLIVKLIWKLVGWIFKNVKSLFTA